MVVDRMTNSKPKNLDEYRKWLRDKHGVIISDRTRAYYDSVTKKVKTDFEQSDCWSQMIGNLNEYEAEYLMKTHYPLFIGGSKPELLLKPYESFLLKTYRINVLDNKNWSNEPADGWVLPDNWYTKIHDILRTLLVVKYLDGVEFMIDKMRSFFALQGTTCRVILEAREEGYYAAHLYTSHQFEIPKITWDTERVNVTLEIQITTQLQEVIRKLLHKYYEEKRLTSTKEQIKWQWDYKSDEFITSYLGHILHYVEGMIMEIRERQEVKTI
jgi:hypothetical protein